MRVKALLIAVCCSACESADCVDGSVVWTEPPGGAFAVCGDLVVTGRRPQDMEVMRRLEAVEGSLIVETNPELTEIPELSGLERIGGSLSISNNPELARIAGFPALVTVGGGVYVGENDALTSLTLGDALTSTSSLFLALNPLLREFRCQIVEVEDDVTVTGNSSLEGLEMPALTGVGGTFVVTLNMRLRELDFRALRSVDGVWQITDNPSLQVLTGFRALEQAGRVQVSGNAELRELTFSGAFTGSVRWNIYDNARLERLVGGANVQLSQETAVFVYANPGLKAVDGFSGVVQLEHLTIEDHAQLAEITGFAELTRVSNLEITDNAVLTGPAVWFPQLEHADVLSIYRNSSLPPSHVDELLSHMTVTETPRIGDNMGQSTAFDPCPWRADGRCDAPMPPEDGLCASDPEDCGN